MKSTASLHSASHTLRSPFSTRLSHTAKWKWYRTPPANQCVRVGGTCRSRCRFRLMAHMWFSNQAVRQHTRVCLLSINRRRLHPLIILLKGSVGFIWHPLSPASLPSSYVKSVFCSRCTNVPVYDRVPFCHNRYCLENGMGQFTCAISLRIGDLFSRGKFVLREQPLWEMTVVYSDWLWWYECWKIPVKKHLVCPAVNKPPSKQPQRSSHNRWALLMSPLFQHWGDISRLIALDYRCAPWILITLEMSRCN